MIDRTIKAILLDLDGTLANSLPVMFKTYLDFLKAFSVTGTIDEFKELNGPSLLEVVRILQKKYNLPGRPGELYRKYVDLVSRRYPVYAKLNTGASSLIAFASQYELKLAVVSSADADIVRGFIDRNGLKGLFRVIVSADDVEIAKPDPAIYRLAMRQLHVNPDEGIAVEDSLNGITSATSAGLRTLAMDPYDQLPDLKVPNLIGRIKTLADVVGYINKEADAAE
jgi:beta-phosphoglucomutase